MAYIYQIINDINDKIYVGKTEFSIEKRFKEHCNASTKIRNEHRPLYSAMRKYGIEHFHIELIEETDKPEEREVYWIEQKRSFKNGYNATMGGDGKKYIDYDLVIATYNELQNISETANKLNISKDQCSKILHSNDIFIQTGQEINAKKMSKSVLMYDLQDNFIQAFPSHAAAARWLIENGYSHCKETTIRYHIAEVCNGKRKTAASFKWKLK